MSHISQNPSKPLVSILIPVYNRENLLGHCIESALNQSFIDFEVIVVDNASIDGTWDVCQYYAGLDPRVRIFRNEVNLGPVRNWRRCIDEAKGVYGKILFSDDLMSPDFIAKTVPFLVSKDVGFVFSSVAMGSSPGLVRIAYNFADRTGIFPASYFIKASLYGGDVPISPGCAIFRIKDLKSNLMSGISSPSIPDFSAHGAGPDVLLLLLTAGSYSSIAYLDEPLTFFREHEGSISISARNHDLLNCYTQAKIWFAEYYYDKDTLYSYYSHTWYHYCKCVQYWYRPSSFLAQFTKNPTTSLAAPIFKLLVSKVYGKIINLLSHQVHK